MNKYQAIVPENIGKTTLDKYLVQAFPLLPPHVLRDAFAARDVKMNQERMPKDALVLPGATVSIFTPFTVELPIVYEDENILLINKPAGISTQEDGRGGMTVLSLLTARARGAYEPRLCHRLDHCTSGLLLLCKDDESEALIRECFQERKLTKIYQCLVRGQMRPPVSVCKAYLVKDAIQGQVRIVSHDTPGSVPIETGYETLDYDGELSRLRIRLFTGRTHQIRAHMSYLAHPLLGDDLYGDRALNRRYKNPPLKLCATEFSIQPQGKLAYLADQTFQIQPPF